MKVEKMRAALSNEASMGEVDDDDDDDDDGGGTAFDAAARKERDEAFAEIDPNGRYGRYSILLGEGSTKKVYRGFDLLEGIEVAWNQIHLVNFAYEEGYVDTKLAETRFLRAVHHPNILKIYAFWVDSHNCNINFITEICTSGSLRDYRLRHPHVSLKAVKKWSLQILRGLDYLHSQCPCIIHRDINPSNVFINGNTGKVMIGDFGQADAVARRGMAMHDLVGTPEYMAPELFREDYTEKVDVYSFGMCVLELVTLEIPYSECGNFMVIYGKVMDGIKPRAFDKVTDPEVRTFIERCIAPCDQRPSVSELLLDPFFGGVSLGPEG